MPDKLDIGGVYTIKEISKLEKLGIISKRIVKVEDGLCYAQGDNIFYLNSRTNGMYQVVYSR